MARRLRTYVHVAGVVYGPGDEVPAAVAKRIGDHAWEDSVGGAQEQTSGDEQSSAGGSSSSKRPAAKRAATRKE